MTSPGVAILSSDVGAPGAPASLRTVVQDLIALSVLPFGKALPGMLQLGRRATNAAAIVLDVDATAVAFHPGSLTDPPDGRIDPEQATDGQVIVTPLPLAAEEGVAAALTILTRTTGSLSDDQALALDLVVTFATGLVRREARRLADEARTVNLLERLDTHLANATSVEDRTRNGISVALGWLDALANDRIDSDDRRSAVSSATRRLELVQSAVDEMIEGTSHHLLEELPVKPTDIVSVWESVTGPRVAVRGATDAVAFSNARALAEFLAVAAPVLVPEVRTDADWIRINVVDATRLSRRARVLLRASSGTLLQDAEGTFAAWCRARPSR